MSAIYDYVSLVAVIALVAGAIYGAMAVASFLSKAVDSTKENLKKQGIDVSRGGVSVKTHYRGVDREEILDATQRGIVNALNSAQYGTSDAKKSVGAHLAHRSTPSRSHLRDLSPSSGS